MKKILALVLAMLMVIGMTAALADVPAANTGKITIANAAKGETYKIYKLFDATVGANGEIAYTGSIPSDLSEFFTKDTAGNISKAAGKTDAEVATAVQNFIKALPDSSFTEANTKVAEGSALEFTNLPFGYYGIKSSQGATVTVDSTNPTVTVYDKNEKEIELSKTVDDTNVKIGQTVTYTVDFTSVNYVGTGNAAKKVDKYTITDTLPAFLKDVVVTGITVGGTAIETKQFDENKKIEIPWVDAEGNHLYANGAIVEITYTAVVTDSVDVTATGNTNKVTLTPHFDDGTEGQPKEDEETIWSYTFGLIKVDDSGAALADATFLLPFYVKQVGDSNVYNYAGTTASDGAVNTVTTTDNGQIYIHGIATDETHNTPADEEAGTAAVIDTEFSITETVAPKGFNKLTAAFTVVAKPERSTTVKRYWDENGKLTDTVTETITNFTAAEPVSGFKTVINKAGAELPSTGGMGTTILYIAGSVLVLAAAILLITKRRMNAND